MNEEFEIVNYVVNGCSICCFINEGCWVLVFFELKVGDYVLIQFGYNDQKVDDLVWYVFVDKDYLVFLKQYIVDVCVKDVIFMIVSFICCCYFDNEGNL